MKKVFTRILLLCIASAVIYSCDNGNADIEVFDSAPLVTFGTAPSSVIKGREYTAEINASDGELSAISSISYVLTDTIANTEAATGTIAGSGTTIATTLTLSTENLDESVYKLVVTAADSKGLTATAETNFEVVGDISIGIIGDATPRGWDADTDLTRSEEDFDMWTAEITLTNGEAKFRQNDDWGVNWGDASFPSGTGTQDGSNIPIAAGDYLVTFNSATGEYSFEAQ